jgi:hypothetical protein
LLRENVEHHHDAEVEHPSNIYFSFSISTLITGPTTITELFPTHIWIGEDYAFRFKIDFGAI